MTNCSGTGNPYSGIKVAVGWRGWLPDITWSGDIRHEHGTGRTIFTSRQLASLDVVVGAVENVPTRLIDAFPRRWLRPSAAVRPAPYRSSSSHLLPRWRRCPLAPPSRSVRPSDRLFRRLRLVGARRPKSRTHVAPRTRVIRRGSSLFRPGSLLQLADARRKMPAAGAKSPASAGVPRRRRWCLLRSRKARFFGES